MSDRGDNGRKDNPDAPSLEERATHPGSKLGDRRVRIVRPAAKEFRRRGGHYVATPRVVVPISRIDRASLRALSIAGGLGGDVHAVHISYDPDGASAFKRRWKSVVGETIALDTIISPYRALMPPLLKYLDAIDRGDPGRPIIVVLAEFVPRHWWEALLHNQTALLLKLRLFVRRNTAVLDVPYHLDDPEPLDVEDERPRG